MAKTIIDNEKIQAFFGALAAGLSESARNLIDAGLEFQAAGDAARLPRKEIEAAWPGEGAAAAAQIQSPAPGAVLAFFDRRAGAFLAERIVNPAAAGVPEELTELHQGALQEFAGQALAVAAARLKEALGFDYAFLPPQVGLGGLAGAFEGAPPGAMDFACRLELNVRFKGEPRGRILLLAPDITLMPFARVVEDSPADPEAKAAMGDGLAPEAPQKPVKETVVKQRKSSTPAVSVKPETKKKPGVFKPQQENLDALAYVPVTVVAVLGRARLSLEEILSLGAGSIVPLETDANGPIEVCVNGKTVACGQVVVVDQQFAVKIEKVASS